MRDSLDHKKNKVGVGVLTEKETKKGPTRSSTHGHGLGIKDHKPDYYDQIRS